MGWFSHDSEEARYHDEVLYLRRSKGLGSDDALSTSSFITKPNPLMRLWAVPLRSTLLMNMRSTSNRVASPSTTPRPRNFCKLPSTNCPRQRSAKPRHVYSAGFSGAFIDREAETHGVRCEDPVAITLPIKHSHSSTSSRERRQNTMVRLSLQPTRCVTNNSYQQIYSQEEGREGLRKQLLLGVNAMRITVFPLCTRCIKMK